MQAITLANDHTTDCFRYHELSKKEAHFLAPKKKA